MADDKPIETWTDLTRFLDEEFAVILEKVPSSGNNAEKLGALEQLRGGLMDARHRLNDEQFKMYTDGIQAPDYLTSQTQDEDLYINRLAPALRKLYEKGAGPDDLVCAGVPADSLVYHYFSKLDRAVGKGVELKGMPAPATAKTGQE